MTRIGIRNNHPVVLFILCRDQAGGVRETEVPRPACEMSSHFGRVQKRVATVGSGSSTFDGANYIAKAMWSRAFPTESG